MCGLDVCAGAKECCPRRMPGVGTQLNAVGCMLNALYTPIGSGLTVGLDWPP